MYFRSGSIKYPDDIFKIYVVVSFSATIENPVFKLKIKIRF